MAPPYSMRRVLPALLVALAALLGSCSTVRLSYEHADWLLARMAGRYVELDNTQARVLKARLGALHAWHRSEELPQYTRGLEEAADRIARGLTRQDVHWAVDELRERGQALSEQAGEDLVPLLRTLSERQLDEAARELNQDNVEFAKSYLSGDPARRAARRAAWLYDKLADWIGPLTQEQRARVDAFVAAFPDSVALRLEERRRYQAVLLKLVREYRSSPQFEARLRAFLADPAAGRAQANQSAALKVEEGFVDLLLALDRSLTPAQRKAAITKLRAYAADFRQLSASQSVAAN